MTLFLDALPIQGKVHQLCSVTVLPEKASRRVNLLSG